MIQKSAERPKTSFLKETSENADLHKAVLNKIMTTQGQCVKYDFVAPLTLKNKQPSYFQHSNVFETVLSDFHLLTVTEFKMGFQKLKPQVITYRNYKHFNNDRFPADIKTCGFDAKDINSFKETILSVFNKYAPIKKKYIRANEAPFMTKNLHKEIMKRSRLRNKYLKSKCLTERKKIQYTT